MEHGKYISEEVSWITPVLGITGYEGIEDIERFQYGVGNDYIINTAGELNNRADVKIPVEPSMGARQTLKRVDMIADIIHEQLYSFKRLPSEYKVIVHCAMGMERSVLAVAWYLQKYENYTLDSAYERIHEIRPIACDRSSWIGKELSVELNENASWEQIMEPRRLTNAQV
jgi:protein-tyrosine phosphatase